MARIRHPKNRSVTLRSQLRLDLTQKQVPSGIERAESAWLQGQQPKGPERIREVLDNGGTIPLMVDPEQISASSAAQAVERGDFIMLGTGDVVVVAAAGAMMRIAHEGGSRYVQLLTVRRPSRAAWTRYEGLRAEAERETERIQARAQSS